VKILEGLNPQQLQAATHYKGSYVINAGPGAGKTATIVTRTAYMVRKGVRPEDIVLFTFTKKAAEEIKTRIIKKVGEPANKITVGTYHSVCVRLLRKYANYLEGYERNFSIYDTEDIEKMLKDMLKKCEVTSKELTSYISNKKHNLISYEVAERQALTSLDQEKARLYRLYEISLQRQNAMDFDGLIYNAIQLLRENKEVVDYVNSKWKYITADEGHDSSHSDMELIKLLGGQTKNICIILDDDQSIYSFRGASPDAVNSFIREYKPTIFNLEQNYRCSGNILRAARSLISHNSHEIEKNLFTENEMGALPMYFAEIDQRTEAQRVMQLVLMLRNKLNIKYDEIAVLYRMGYLSRHIEDALIQAGVRYKVVGSVPFYSRKEVKDLMAYVALMLNKKNTEAFKRVINTPKRGIGPASLEPIIQYAVQNNVDNIESCKAANLKGKAKAGMEHFLAVIDELSEGIETRHPADTINEIVAAIDYYTYIRETFRDTEEVEDKIKIVEDLISIAANFNSLEEFMESMVMNHVEQDEDEDTNGSVSLMTLHGSKGLEYKAVILISANEGTCPHWRATTTDQIAEERRLFYVGMTRAEEYLFITRSKMSEVRGRPQSERESRFLQEINAKYLRNHYKSKTE
jgi:DNA helicase-2/ATP-dependent DNA helicase PcrA